MIMLNTPEQIHMFRLLQMAGALSFEINSGMKMTRIPLTSACRRNGWSTSRSKKGCLADMVDLIREAHPDPLWMPPDSYKAALGI